MQFDERKIHDKFYYDTISNISSITVVNIDCILCHMASTLNHKSFVELTIVIFDCNFL